MIGLWVGLMFVVVAMVVTIVIMAMVVIMTMIMIVAGFVIMRMIMIHIQPASPRTECVAKIAIFDV